MYICISNKAKHLKIQIMKTLTITSAKREILEGKTINILNVSEKNIFTVEMEKKEYKLSFYMLPKKSDGSFYSQTLTTEQEGGFEMWIEDVNGKKTKRTRIYTYTVN